jgi:hypothetical protein
MTGERRDESVQFSLHELMRLEDERIAREKRDREAAEAAAIAAREASERREREERERAIAATHERERTLRFEEEARREAMSRAAVEQARISVEARTRAEESERERRHELELAKLRMDVARPHGPGLLLGSGAVGAALAFAVCGAAYFGEIRPAQARTVEGLEGAVARAEAKANDVGRENLEQGRSAGGHGGDRQAPRGAGRADAGLFRDGPQGSARAAVELAVVGHRQVRRQPRSDVWHRPPPREVSASDGTGAGASSDVYRR